jgi:hypothetical protein
MPRQGDGSGDNAIEAGHNIIHGAGQPEVRTCTHLAAHNKAFKDSNTSHLKSTRVGRADKTAPMPEPSKGAGLEKTTASAGDSKGKDQGGRNRTN